jgi:heterodisulfide reductase subunit B
MNKPEPWRYAFFPGCSLHGSVQEYDRSLHAVCATLGLTLQEIPGWSCCGASSAHGYTDRLGTALPARNLFLAGQMGLRMATACPACNLRSREAERMLSQDEGKRREMEGLLGGPVPVGDGQRTPFVSRFILEILLKDFGLDQLAKWITHPLSSLRVAAYYGCLLTRPGLFSAEGDPERPASLEKIIEVTGARWSDWSYKTECCGGFLGVTRPEKTLSLVKRIVADARATGAQALVTACPLCFINLDTRQQTKGGSPLPVLHFTELLGMAMGLDVTGSLRRHLIQNKSLGMERRIGRSCTWAIQTISSLFWKG